MESSEESKGGTTANEPSVSPPKPTTRRKSTQNRETSRNQAIISKEDSEFKSVTSDGQIPAEILSRMASKMIDTILHNYETPSTPSKAIPSTSSTTKRKKSKASLQKTDNKSGEKENVNGTPSFQKLVKLADCVECGWAHNYHPCLLSNPKNNTKCKDDMKQKGYQYNEPKQHCENEQICTVKTPTTSSADTNKQLQPSKNQITQNTKSKALPTMVTGTVEESKKPKAVQPVQKQAQPVDVPRPKPTPSKHKQSQTDVTRPKPTPSKHNQSPTAEVSRPKTTPSTKSPAAKTAIKKSTRDSFENKNKPSKVTIADPKPQPSKSNVVIKDDVKPSSSRLMDDAKLDLLTKLTSTKSSNINKTAQDSKINRLVASLPVSTSESRTRFNPRQPSPSATHLPPIIVPAHELKCKDQVTANCVLNESTPASKKFKPAKSTIDKKVVEADKLIAEGKHLACEWQKNYHPCDKSKQSDKTGDKEECKVWKKGKGETDPIKNNMMGSRKSVADPTVLATSASERAYIDQVVRTAVKLAKQNIAANCKKPRRKYRRDLESGTIAAAAASSAFSQANTMVENAIFGAAQQTRPAKQCRAKKPPVGTTGSLAESSSKKKL